MKDSRIIMEFRMRNYKRNKSAYTIAEVMIVLLILTVIFAAFAPIITKRKLSSYKSSNAIWNKYNETKGFDAYFDPSNTKNTGTAFFGVKPDSHGAVTSTLTPLSRVVIRSGPVTSGNKLQRQIQFRFGRLSGNAAEKKYGKFAGTWLMDRQNVLLGGAYPNIDNTPDNIEARDNVAIGYQSMNALKNAQGNTALGLSALSENISGKYNTAIGYNAGSTLQADYNTYIGAGAGEKASGSRNTAVGYQAGYNNSGSVNVFVGANAGRTGSGSYNVGIGYDALRSVSGNYNVAIGTGALKNLTTGSYNTAIGYNACSEVTTGSHKTCIGYNSGPGANTQTSYKSATGSWSRGQTVSDYLGSKTDNLERTYIGGRPYNYGGDAVMEIHNVGGTNSNLINNPGVKSNTTTVINGNLIVRGRTMMTIGSKLWSFVEVDPKGSSAEHSMGYYSNNNIGTILAGNQQDYTVCYDTKVNTGPFPLKLKGGVCLDSTSSDRRLKNIGTRSIAGLKELNQLKIYDYTFKNDKSKHSQIGVMAQDLQKVFPNSVFEGPDGYLRIRWDEMFFASINAIKELDRKIVSLVNRATKVETQIARLEQENISLKTQVDALSVRVEKLKNK
ncbi:MAG TPA: hypothetical protein DCS44_05520 [Cyanobacteria bacterium UBA10660]|nr:MAG TPA: hypothetical protein CPT83_05770 [Candidatus Gastranaerophilales bacterium HUM_1]HAS94056.1 hypothetical protein [Cyanobacteria bacterium UBA10660]